VSYGYGAAKRIEIIQVFGLMMSDERRRPAVSRRSSIV
jgi:hypothetical protein